MTARLHVMLGAGGVGKTTLAAAYALAMAQAPNRRVGLLGIDPSRRLKDALGISLADVDARVPCSGSLRAAILDPSESVRRWATEACPDAVARERLFGNPFFSALADRLATATDIFAAARISEWMEHDPELTDLVIDTAPGLNAIEFLTRPERVAAFLGGRLVGWLRWLARTPRGASQATRVGRGTRRIFGGLVRIAGSQVLVQLADFFSLVDVMFARMLARVEATQRWLRDPTTEILVVTSVRDDGAETVVALARALSSAELHLRAVIMNRALPPRVDAELGEIDTAAFGDEAAAVFRYVRAYLDIQARVTADISPVAPSIVTLPALAGLDTEKRLEILTSLGSELGDALSKSPA